MRIRISFRIRVRIRMRIRIGEGARAESGFGERRRPAGRTDALWEREPGMRFRRERGSTTAEQGRASRSNPGPPQSQRRSEALRGALAPFWLSDTQKCTKAPQRRPREVSDGLAGSEWGEFSTHAGKFGEMCPDREHLRRRSTADPIDQVPVESIRTGL